jgi:hypothetical protein
MTLFKSISGVAAAILLFMAFLEIHYLSDLYEILLVEYYFASWNAAPYLIRVLVGLYWAASFLLLFPNYFRKAIASFVSLTTLLIVLFFGYQLFISKKSYCESSFLPYVGDAKQMLLYFSGAFLFSLPLAIFPNNFYFFQKKINTAITVFVFIATLCLSFLLNPLSIETRVVNDATKLPVELLYQTSETPDIDLTKGKHIVAFMSYSCGYCTIAAKKFRALQKLNTDIPFYIIVGGAPENEARFFETTCATSLKHFKITEANQDAFWKLAGSSIPAIYLIDNTNIYKQIHYSELNKKKIEHWLEN